MKKFMYGAAAAAVLLLLGLIIGVLYLRLASEAGWHCAGSSSPCPDCAAEREKEAGNAK